MTKPESCASRALVLGLAAALAVASHAAAADCPAPDAAAGGPVNAHTRYLETTMLPAVADADSKPRTLAERMAAWQVPGVTVAVIKSGKLDWARGWGVRDLSTCAPVFAMVVMQLAEAGTLDIDADIATQLTSWTLPAARRSRTHRSASGNC
jgi:CubicO group peptidase (beta-lactamase class C family)